jgi:GGDEF domain-containing protein
MHKEKHYAAKSIQILPGNPTATAIHQILTWALENLDKQVEVIWPSATKGSEYKLTAHADPMGGDPQWKLIASNAGQGSLLWEFTSCDSLLVFNRIEASLNDREGNQHSTTQSVTQEEQAEEKAFFYIPEALTKQRATIPIPLVGGDNSLNRSSGTVLNGDLAFVQIGALLQSIALAKMTGRLEIQSELGAAEVFFIDGQPIHATSPAAKGPECIYELITWKDGRFFFQPKVMTKHKTISDPLDSLIIQGAQIFDKQNFLKNSGFKIDAVMVKTQRIVDEADLRKLLKPAIPVDFVAQRRFYDAIDDRLSTEEIVAKLGYARSLWVPIVCNMLSCGLAAFTKPAKKGNSSLPTLEPKTVDSAAIQSVIMQLRRGDTGMFNFPAFLYFLEQEYFRGHRSGSPISVIVFEMRVKSGPNGSIREPLPIGALREAVLRISQAKRHNDLLAHYEAFDYALLCPDTKGEGARVFAKRLMVSLMKSPLSTGVDERTLSLSFGAACVPEDFLELGLLLSAAEAAKGHSLSSEEPVVLYRDLLPKAT